ncbi:MAG: hypothetical protein ACOC1N_00975 [Bacillota bacterium]
MHNNKSGVLSAIEPKRKPKSIIENYDFSFSNRYYSLSINGPFGATLELDVTKEGTAHFDNIQL